MTQPNIQQALLPGSTALGVVTKTVYIDSVSGPVAIVHDQFGVQARMRRDVMRAKGDPPAAGETWIVDKVSTNDWVFSVCMQAPVVQRATQADHDVLAARVDEQADTITQLSRQPAVCRTVLGVDVAITAGGDIFAHGDWSAPAGDDPDGIFYPAGAAGPGNSTYSRIVVPNTGRYWVSYRCTYTAGSTYSGACFIAKNSPASSASVARDTRNINQGTGSDDRTPPHAHDMVKFVAGDVLYWGNWISVSGTITRITQNVLTSMKLHQLGWR